MTFLVRVASVKAGVDATGRWCVTRRRQAPPQRRRRRRRVQGQRRRPCRWTAPAPPAPPSRHRTVHIWRSLSAATALSSTVARSRGAGHRGAAVSWRTQSPEQPVSNWLDRSLFVVSVVGSATSSVSEATLKLSPNDSADTVFLYV